MLPAVLYASNVMDYYKAKIFIPLLYMSHLKNRNRKELKRPSDKVACLRSTSSVLEE